MATAQQSTQHRPRRNLVLTIITGLIALAVIAFAFVVVQYMFLT